jgi:hypothetical protein
MIAKNITTSATLVCVRGFVAQHILYNDSDVTIYLGLDGDPAVTTSTGIPIAPGQTIYHEPASFGPAGPPAIYAIHGSTGNKVLRYGNTSFITA